MADNIESNKDFVLLSTNLNGYKTSDDSNDKNLVFTKKEFERFDNRYDLVTQKQIDSIQLDYNAYKQPISNELNYKPTTNQQIQYNQEFTLNNNKNNLNYDWSIGGTQPPNNYQYGYANQTFIQNQPNYHEYTNQYNSAKYSNNYVYPYNQINGSYENDSYPNNLNYSALRNTNQSNYTNQNYYDTNTNVPTSTNNISNGMAYQFNQNTLQYYPKERVNSAILTTNPTVSTSSTSTIQPYVTSIDQQNVSQYQKEIDLNSSMFYVNKPNPVIHNSNINQINVNNQLAQQQNPNFGNQSRTTKPILQNNKNNSLQSPSSSSPTSTVYSSLNGNNENQENVSTDEDESDIDESEEEDDDEDDDDEEVNEKNSKKLTTNQMNAPWIQSGKKISRKQTKKKKKKN